MGEYLSKLLKYGQFRVQELSVIGNILNVYLLIRNYLCIRIKNRDLK